MKSLRIHLPDGVYQNVERKLAADGFTGGVEAYCSILLTEQFSSIPQQALNHAHESTTPQKPADTKH